MNMKEQALSERDGHRFDVLTTRAQDTDAERQFYFNIDMPWKALHRSFERVLDPARSPGGKKKEPSSRK
jgi:hypothetical protein